MLFNRKHIKLDSSLFWLSFFKYLFTFSLCLLAFAYIDKRQTYTEKKRGKTYPNNFTCSTTNDHNNNVIRNSIFNALADRQQKTAIAWENLLKIDKKISAWWRKIAQHIAVILCEPLGEDKPPISSLLRATRAHTLQLSTRDFERSLVLKTHNSSLASHPLKNLLRERKESIIRRAQSV